MTWPFTMPYDVAFACSDTGYEDLDPYDYAPRPTRYVRGRTTRIKCKYCGEENLRWSRKNDRWALYTLYGQRHFCQLITTKRQVREVHLTLGNQMHEAADDDAYGRYLDEFQKKHPLKNALSRKEWEKS